MKHPLPLPGDLAAAPFSVAQAHGAGLGPDRLERKDLIAAFRSVRIPATLWAAAKNDDERFRLLCEAYRTKLPRGWFFSHATAARILGMPLPPRLETTELHISSRDTDSRPRGRGVRGHRAPGAHTSSFFGFRVRVPAEVWCELASALTVDELIAAGDRLLADEPTPLTTRRHLEAAVAEHAAGRGARALREALPQLRENVWSPRETWLRLVILRAGLPEPMCNRTIRGRDGKRLAIGDLVYPEFKIVIEYEGERWHPSPWSGIDVDRYNALVLLGWVVIRVRKHHRPEDVVAMVRDALMSRGWRP